MTVTVQSLADSKFRKALFDRIDARADQFLDWLTMLAKIPSVSATGTGIRECATELSGLMGSLGIATQLLETGGEPLLRGAIGRGGHRIVIYGHYDVQPADPSEGWLDHPFLPVVRDGAIWGRGVGDNKGQLLAHLCALAAWHDVFGEPPPFEIIFAFDGEEEIGSPHTITFVEKNPQLFTGDFLFMADGSTLGIWNPAIFLESHGLLYLELSTEGAISEWHSGSYGSILPNPVLQLIDALRALVDNNGRVLVPGFYDHVLVPDDTKRHLLDLLPPDFLTDPDVYGAKRFATDNPRKAMFFEPKLCICGIAGGYGGDGVKTAVPTSAKAKLDVTLAPNQSPAQIEALIRQHLNRKGYGEVNMKTLASCPPIVAGHQDQHVQMVIRAMTDVWGKSPTIFPSIGGGGPLAAFASHGMTCVCVPYAQADLHEHSIEEHLSLDWFQNGIKTTAEIFRLFAAKISL